MNPFRTLARLIERDGAGALVTVVAARGSTPREAGARMVVSRDGAISGTIGGGRLENEAIADARRLAATATDTSEVRRFALGPALGQCCGGHVTLLIEAVTAARLGDIAEIADAAGAGPIRTEARVEPGRPLARTILGPSPDGRADADLGPNGVLAETVGRRARPLFLFGAGHVGRSLVLALAPLPFDVTWIDARADMFPAAMPSTVRPVATDAPESVAAAIPEGAFVLVMTHDHGVDLAILHAALATGRAAYAGLIGSATKRARFERRLRDLGLPETVATGFRCPIGVAGIKSKEPALIAASVAAELLVADEALAGRRTAAKPLIGAVDLGAGGGRRRV
ncbi:MAG TPA: xanthine dehydrogenase accessory protein XdhC [Methylomirabilota bacterium]|nr:xanthine dehydrogenase accessory protein XdhC [Methylomirabilota bacterium]